MCITNSLNILLLSFVGLQLFVYYSVYPPLVYLIFMAKFFETAEHWPLRNKKLQKKQRKERQQRREQERQRREGEALLKAAEDNGDGKEGRNSWPLIGGVINSSSSSLSPSESSTAFPSSLPSAGPLWDNNRKF